MLGYLYDIQEKKYEKSKEKKIDIYVNVYCVYDLL